MECFNNGVQMKIAIGLFLAVCVGIGCRWFGIPLPGPPAIMGAAMAVAMATGYTATDYFLARKSTTAPPTAHVAADQSDLKLQAALEAKNNEVA
jgi:XapX domain-containing protein